MSDQSLIDTAKAPTIAYNEKNWDRVKATVTPEFVYDEVATQRKAQGVSEAITTWQGWAKALPDSKATFHNAVVGGNTIVIELTWRGTHTGPLDTPSGQIAPSGKKVELRACQLIEVRGDKVQSMRQYFDLATLLQQVGAMPERAAR